MKKIVMACAAACVALAVSGAQAQNLLSNPGFESPTSTTTSVGNWFRFGSGPGGFAADDTSMPRTGQGNMYLETIGTNQFAGVFQKLPNPISPGAQVTFSGWHKSVGPDAATHEIKIEWMGAPQNRLDVFNIGTDYQQFSHTAIAPAGTTGATVTYAISTFGAGQGNSITLVDDLVATVIPEPASAGMAIAGLAMLAGLRRRK